MLTSRNEAALPPPAVELPEDEARRFDLLWAGAMVAALAAVFVLISLFSGVSVPVLLALGAAYALNPVVTWLERRFRVGRTWGTLAVFVSLFRPPPATAPAGALPGAWGGQPVTAKK